MPEKEIAENALICGRALYEQTDVPMVRIAEMMGLGQSTLSRRVVMMGWTLRPASRLGQRKTPPPEVLAHSVKGLSARIRTQIERQIQLAEYDLSKPGARAARANDSERAARTLASLVKTMTELKRFEGETTRDPRTEDDDFDIDEFRRELTRDLEALLERSADEARRLADAAGQA